MMGYTVFKFPYKLIVYPIKKNIYRANMDIMDKNKLFGLITLTLLILRYIGHNDPSTRQQGSLSDLSMK